MSDKDSRRRSAAYPFEVVYRLINMYSAKGDIVLDPFLGTGTTTAAAIASGRNSIGYEIDPALEKVIDRIKDVIVVSSKQLIRKRLAKHMEFVVHRLKTKGGFKYENKHYGFPIMTAQEKELIFNDPIKIIQPETLSTFLSTYPPQSPIFNLKNKNGSSQELPVFILELWLGRDLSASG